MLVWSDLVVSLNCSFAAVTSEFPRCEINNVLFKSNAWTSAVEEGHLCRPLACSNKNLGLNGAFPATLWVKARINL